MPPWSRQTALAARILVAFAVLLCGRGLAADFEFFEKRIRPVLVAECHQCHAGENAKGKLRLDHRAGWQSSDSLIVPGNPRKSRLIQVLRHELPDLKMPKDGARLDESIIADFEKWIIDGAPDPREKPTRAEATSHPSWETIREFRKQWWSFQPVRDPAIPTEGNQWSSHPVDRFVWRGFNRRGLAPSEPAERRQLIRRTYFALIGLPPNPAEMEAALRMSHSALVDELLVSKHFGERWARHWLDWFRYAESHGSEGDAPIPHAHRYRDYVIRALNANVSYDQLIREHLAGDLLDEPRVNDELGLNESAIGIAHFRMVQHGYQPTEPMMEMVRFVDDQIDVVSKAFLGLTVSCARCHDHKFDPISQKDYYAMFGIFRSSLPAIVSVNAPGQLDRNRRQLAELKPKIRDAIAAAWLKYAERIPDLLQRDRAWLQAIKESRHDKPLHIWKQLADKSGRAFRTHWNKHQSFQLATMEYLEDDMKDRFRRAWNPTTIQSDWFKNGTAWKDGVTRAGEFFVEPTGEKLIRGVYPRGLYSHLISSKHNGQLNSPKFKITGDSMSVRVMGNDLAQARLVVGNYPLPRGGIYGMRSQPWHEEPLWHKWDTTYWKGEEAHIEVATHDELTFFSQAYREGRKPDRDDGRSYIGITDVVFDDDGQEQPIDERQESWPLFQGAPPANSDQLAAHFREVMKECVGAWKSRNLDDRQAAFLDYFLQQGLLPNDAAAIPEAGELVTEYRRLEAEIPTAVRSSGVLETVGMDQPLLARGDYRKPTDPVSRRFLEVFGARSYQTPLSGRREFAEDLLRPDNPLVARVLVNRVWAYLFGEGIVPSTDNFGRLGSRPTHPELLDHLATWFVNNGYSIKKLIAYLTKTRAYQLASAPSERASRVDPANVWLSHFRVRRLDAESLRDALLATSGRLDRKMFGEPESGIGNRRSIYVRAKRNSRDEFLKTFDAPEPLSTRSKRDLTNVPAQSLALLNNPFVKNSARVLGERLAATPGSIDARLNNLFETVLSRPATEFELAAARAMKSAMLNEGSELQTRVGRLSAERTAVAEKIEMIAGAARRSILEHGKKSGAKPMAGPRPYLLWTFDKNADESLIGLKGRFFGNAHISNGALVVDGDRSYVLTDRIPKDLREKTLEVRVQLDNLEQRGGGVITIQSPNGGIFDAIVFGEQKPRRWLAGSNGFSRTRPFQGEAESEAASQPVHITIVYSKDGTITGYRNGSRYGKPYRSAGPFFYAANNHLVGFGIRHLKAGGNRMLKGRILEARLYDRALSAREVSAAAGRESEFIPEEELIAAMSSTSQRDYRQEKKRLEKLNAQLSALEKVAPPSEKTVWAELVHTVYNLKEFIYLR